MGKPIEPMRKRLEAQNKLREGILTNCRDYMEVVSGEAPAAFLADIEVLYGVLSICRAIIDKAVTEKLVKGQKSPKPKTPRQAQKRGGD